MQAITVRATRIILAVARNTSNQGSVAWQLPPADRRNLPRVRRSQSKFRSMSNFGIGGNSPSWMMTEGWGGVGSTFATPRGREMGPDPHSWIASRNRPNSEFCLRNRQDQRCSGDSCLIGTLATLRGRRELSQPD